MELGQTHMVGVLNDKGVYVGNINAGLNNGGAHQYSDLSLAHSGHGVVQLVLGHFSVGNGNHGVLPQHLLNTPGCPGDGLHPVVEVVDLAAPLQLPAHGVGKH